MTDRRSPYDPSSLPKIMGRKPAVQGGVLNSLKIANLEINVGKLEEVIKNHADRALKQENALLALEKKMEEVSRNIDMLAQRTSGLVLIGKNQP